MTVASSEPLAHQPAAHAANARTTNPTRRYLGFALKSVVTLATLYWVARSVSVEQLAQSLVTADWKWLLLALGIFWMAQFISALRYVYISRTLNCPVPFRLSIRLHFIGLWFNQVFPTGLGGDVVKILMLKPLIGAGKAFRTTILDRASGMIFLLASVVVLLPFYFSVFPEPLQTWALGACAAGALTGAAILNRLAGFLMPFAERSAAAVEILQVFTSLSAFCRKKPLFQQVWTSAVVHVNGIMAYALAGKALGLDLSFADYFLITPLVFLVALIPVSFAGWGIRELGSVMLFGLVGVAPEQATAMSMLFGLMLIVAGVPGVVLLPSYKTQTNARGTSASVSALSPSSNTQ